MRPHAILALLVMTFVPAFGVRTALARAARSSRAASRPVAVYLDGGIARAPGFVSMDADSGLEVPAEDGRFNELLPFAPTAAIHEIRREDGRRAVRIECTLTSPCDRPVVVVTPARSAPGYEVTLLHDELRGRLCDPATTRFVMTLTLPRWAQSGRLPSSRAGTVTPRDGEEPAPDDDADAVAVRS